MSEHILDNPSERIVVNKASTAGESVSTVTARTNILTTLKHKIVAAARFMVELSEEVNRVRAEATKYSRTRW